MLRLRSIGVALLSLLAFGGFMASLSPAEEGVLPNANFSGEGGTITLETSGKRKVSCTSMAILEAKFLTEKEQDQHGLGKLQLTGCKAEGLFAANTLGDASGVILAKALYLVCLVESVKLTYGLLLLPEETLHIEVPTIGTLFLLKGAMIAELESPRKGKEFKFKLAGKSGNQTTALKCEVNGKSFEHTAELSADSEAKDEKADAEVKFTVKFAEEVEFMCGIECNEVEFEGGAKDFNYGLVTVNQDVEEAFNIVANTNVKIEAATLSNLRGAAFLITKQCEVRLYKTDEVCVVKVLFKPLAAGKYESHLEIKTRNDATERANLWRDTLRGEA